MNHFWAAVSVALALGAGTAAALGVTTAAAQGVSSGVARGTDPADPGEKSGVADSRRSAREAEKGPVPVALDATMALMGEAADRPDAVTKTLELPKDAAGAYLASPLGVSHAAEGLETADLARVKGRAFGRARVEAARDEVRAENRTAADEARAAGRAFAEAAAAAAERNREDLGHAPDLGGLPPDRDGGVVPVHASLPGVPARP
jgi:hypothetical protein